MGLKNNGMDLKYLIELEIIFPCEKPCQSSEIKLRCIDL